MPYIIAGILIIITIGFIAGISSQDRSNPTLIGGALILLFIAVCAVIVAGEI